MQRTAFIATIVSLVTGCMVSTAQLGPMTSGHIGCTPEQTVVFNRQSHWESTTWQAACGEDYYACTGTDGAQGPNQTSAHQVSCSPIPPERVTPELRAAAMQARAQ